jgi:uncharacterized membrane protein YccC
VSLGVCNARLHNRPEWKKSLDFLPGNMSINYLGLMSTMRRSAPEREEPDRMGGHSQSLAVSAPPTLSGTLPLGLPALFYGVRLWAAVSLALFLAFRLELETPSWAGTTAAIVCQPAVGAALRKGWSRMIGTVVGAMAIVLITVAFPQSRVGFLITLALWAGVCAVIATLLRHFASYAGALAGFTAAVVASDMLGATGGASDAVLLLGIHRATEILLGILCASGVLAATDFGGARRRLSESLGQLSVQAAAGLCRALRPGLNSEAERLQRRQLLRQVSGLSVTIDQAAGEISALPFRPRVLQYATDGLFATVSAWRVIAIHRAARAAASEAEMAHVLACLPERLVRESEQPDWLVDPEMLRVDCLIAARRLVALQAETPSQRLLIDAMIRGLMAARQTLGGLGLLRRSKGFLMRPRRVRAIVPDYLPPLLNGIRAFLTIAAADLIWIVTAWPSGGTMIVFATALIILMAPLDEAAYAAASTYLFGALISVILAAIVAFAILPAQTGFAGFCATLGLVLIPAGALSAQPWRQPIFVAIAANFIPLLGPSNAEAYDPAAFCNNALALVSGVGLAALAFRLMPPLSPAFRARRLLTLTLRDLGRLTCGPRPSPASVWRRHAYMRMGAMTDSMDLLQHVRMAAALAVGNAIIRLRHLTDRLGAAAGLDPVLRELRTGSTAGAIAALGKLDAALQETSRSDGAARIKHVVRARANVAELTETLRLHAPYFDGMPAA